MLHVLMMVQQLIHAPTYNRADSGADKEKANREKNPHRVLLTVKLNLHKIHSRRHLFVDYITFLEAWRQAQVRVQGPTGQLDAN